jgi:membrane-associated HD superfamily phosphohydrolase
VLSRRDIENAIADTDGLQKIVGIVIGSAAIVSFALNAVIFITSHNYSRINEFLGFYLVPLILMIAIGVVSFFWKSVIARWSQVFVFFFASCLAALTTSKGDLTSAFFIIFTIILIAEYRFGRYSYYIGAAFAFVLYPIALVIGLNRITRLFL